MKKDLAKWKLFIVTIAAFLVVIVNAGAVYAEPLLVMQPAYVGMKFYIHQPQGIPANWYTTFDGYPVRRGADGVWLYGSYSNKGIIQTNYVVGSVVPSLVGIYPYVTQSNVATAYSAHGAIPTNVIVTSAPPVAQTEIVAPSFPVVAPATNVVTYSVPVVTTDVVPSEYFVKNIDPCFTALGTWRGNVDRVGILVKPSIPVAWKGMWPTVLYAWTGSRWYQMTAREGERPGDVLRNNLYALTRLTHQNGNRYWQAPDVAFLISQTAQWGYVWMGEIGPNPQWVY